MIVRVSVIVSWYTTDFVQAEKKGLKTKQKHSIPTSLFNKTNIFPWNLIK